MCVRVCVCACAYVCMYTCVCTYMNIAINWVSAKWVGIYTCDGPRYYCLWLRTRFQDSLAGAADVKRLICIQYKIYSVPLLFSDFFFFVHVLNWVFSWGKKELHVKLVFFPLFFFKYTFFRYSLCIV